MIGIVEGTVVFVLLLGLEMNMALQFLFCYSDWDGIAVFVLLL